jgi:hypothetical protein
MAAAAVGRGAAARQPNFLFLLADDHAGYVLGRDEAIEFYLRPREVVAKA